jgi:tRNA dimethylallyltransferase
MISRQPPAIFLMGPTAAGKTALAMALCEYFPLDVVSVDSSQVYRGMDIGTAKPSREELERVPHRLIDIRDPSEPYSAAEFREDALREMDDITRRGRVPLLVGGTLFYFRTLEQGLSHLPAAVPELRARLEREARAVGWPALHEQLERIDPVTAARIGRNDRQRIQRALEIYQSTGIPPSELNRQPRAALPYRPIRLMVCPPDRAVLHGRIEQRYHAMIEAGFMAEVEALFRRGDLGPDLPSMRTVGYRQAWLYLSGKINYYEMVQKAIEATRQFAKRQLTWLRSERNLAWVDRPGLEALRESREVISHGLANEGL